MKPVCLFCALAVVWGCKEKEPYRPENVRFTGIGRGDVVEHKAQEAEKRPEVKPQSGHRPVAVVVTAEGSILVEGVGSEVRARRVPQVVRVLSDGGVRTLRVALASQGKVDKASRESVFATLWYGGAGGEKELLDEFSAARPDLKAAMKADPDLAQSFYHTESITLVGAHGPVTTWLLSAEGFLGGAHPYAQRSLVAVDMTNGKTLDFLPKFGQRNLVKEALGQGASGECVRHLSGVGPVETAGGGKAFVAALTHEFESCAGAYKLVRVEPPEKDGEVAGELHDGVFTLSGTDLRVSGVLDFRVSPQKDAVVLLMGLGRNDRLAAPWEKKDGRTREVRVWVKGMDSQPVLGRTAALHSVQFLLDHPLPDAVLASFANLK